MEIGRILPMSVQASASSMRRAGEIGPRCAGTEGDASTSAAITAAGNPGLATIAARTENAPAVSPGRRASETQSVRKQDPPCGLLHAVERLRAHLAERPDRHGGATALDRVQRNLERYLEIARGSAAVDEEPAAGYPVLSQTEPDLRAL
jgi:hypothetical protein